MLYVVVSVCTSVTSRYCTETAKPLLSETFVSPIPREMQHVFPTVCVHMSPKAHVTCNFNYVVETEGLLKVTGSHVHCKCVNIFETVQDRDVVATDH